MSVNYPAGLFSFLAIHVTASAQETTTEVATSMAASQATTSLALPVIGLLSVISLGACIVYRRRLTAMAAEAADTPGEDDIQPVEPVKPMRPVDIPVYSEELGIDQIREIA